MALRKRTIRKAAGSLKGGAQATGRAVVVSPAKPAEAALGGAVEATGTITTVPGVSPVLTATAAVSAGVQATGHFAYEVVMPWMQDGWTDGWWSVGWVQPGVLQEDA